MNQRRHDRLFDIPLQDIVDGIPIRVFWKDRESRYLGCNSLFARDAGLAHPEELIGKTDFEMGWKNQAELYRDDDKLVMVSGIPRLGYEEPQTTPDGRTIWIRTSKVPLRHASQQIVGILGVYQDITELKQVEENQKQLTRALKLLSQCNTLLIHAKAERELLAEICRLAVEAGGYRMAWVGFAEHDTARTVRPVAQSGHEAGYLADVGFSWADNPLGQGPVGSVIRTGLTVVNQDIRLGSGSESWREAALARGYHSLIALPLVIQQQVLGAITIYATQAHAFSQSDVALLEELASNLAYGIETLRARIKHAATQQQLALLAHYDPLTGLPNRLLLHDRFEQAAAKAHREQSGVAVLFLDLDNFKQVNDSHGHCCGDQLLAELSERLKGCIRKTDTASRQGGDEFVILLGNVRDVEIIGKIAQGIIDAIAAPVVIGDQVLTCSLSIGISLYPDDGSELEILLRQADTALFHAKASGRKTYRFFCEQKNVSAQGQLQLQGQLHGAVQNREFVLHYQPRFDMVSGRIVGADTHFHWQHPQMGLIPLTEFQSQAERSGLILPMEEWALEEACQQAQRWRSMPTLPPLVVAVTLSLMQFKRSNLVQTVADTLSRSGLPAKLLELKLNRTALLNDPDTAINTLQGLKKLGVSLSIEDFGSGYLNLTSLKSLPVDKLEMDGSCLHDMVTDPAKADIARAIIELGHTFGLTVIADGVNSDSQLGLLRSFGCDAFQGELLCRPLAVQSFIGFCQQSSPGDEQTGICSRQETDNRSG